MVRIILKCFNCGKEKTVYIIRPLSFAFELVDIANESGMLGVFDFNRNRSLVFCDKDCYNASLTKKGALRYRPNYKK